MQPIADQASRDLGFRVEMQALALNPLEVRVATEPESVDIIDLSFVSIPAITSLGIMQGIEVTRIKDWRKISPILTLWKTPTAALRPRKAALLQTALLG